MKKLFILLILSIFIVGCSIISGPKNIELKTDDGLKIAGLMNSNSTANAVIFLHMLNGKKEDWNNLSNWLNGKGYTTLAIDFRGHGQSEGKIEDFKEEDFEKMVLDVKAAKEYLKDKDYKNIYIVGASIGANVGLRYAASDPDIKKIILLSPGENYKGVTVTDVLDDYKGELYLFSPTELEEEFNFATKLKDSFKGEKLLRVLPGNSNHGTKMIEKFDRNTYPYFELFLRR